MPPFTSWLDASRTIQPAIDLAVAGDTVLINAGTFVGDGNRDLTTQGKAIVVRAASGLGTVTIAPFGSVSSKHRGFVFRNHETAATVVEGLRIYRGYAPLDVDTVGYGGGMLCDSGSSPTIRDCIFDTCTSGHRGGAVACLHGSQPYFLRVRFQRNAVAANSYAVGTGGAVYCSSSSPSFDHCSFDRNSAGRGGAMYCITSSPELLNCMMVRNRARGGMVLFDVYEGVGGACYLVQSSPLFMSTSINFNSAVNAVNQPGEGGAIAMFNLSSPDFVSCTIDGNEALNLDATHPGQGGGLYISGQSDATLNKVIISNTKSGAAVYFLDAPSSADATCSDLYGNAGGDWTGDLANQEGKFGNVSLDPLFCDSTADSLGLLDLSPCSAAHSVCGDLIGAMSVACQTGACLVSITGDVNLTSTRSTSDIVYLVNYVFKGGPVPMPCLASGDVDCSGDVTSADVIYLVNAVLKGGAAPCDVCTMMPGTWTCQ